MDTYYLYAINLEGYYNLQSKRIFTPHPNSEFISYAYLSPSFRAFTSFVSSMVNSKSVHEMAAVHKNETWDLVTICRWVYTMKYLQDVL